ncbi:MAG TPA: LamG-like jellyroll fold domain-containing protein [Planctomycetota bacterium]|nr:LamG-like jellyroll fold domain-containing protein [Planctomycetota bacterium]
MNPAEHDAHLNALIEAYIHNEADETQLRELAAWVEADPSVAQRIILMSMIQGRFRAEGDPTFVAETVAAAAKKKGESGFVRQVMQHLRENSGKEATRLVLPVRSSTSGRAQAKPSERMTERHVESLRLSREPQKDRTWMIAAGVAALLVLSVVARIVTPFGNDKTIAKVTLVSQSASIERNGKTLTRADAMEIEPGDVVSSGSEPMRFRYRNETTVINLAPETRVRVVYVGGQKRLQLLSGRMEASVAPQPKESPMILHTSQAEVRVVGTRFALHEGSGATRLEVSEGKVRLTRKEDGAAVDVPAGHGVKAAQKDASPLTLTKLDRVSEGLVAHWPFEEGSGTVTQDQALGGLPAPIRGAQWVKGKEGWGLSLDGTSFIDVSNCPHFNFSAGAPFSLAGWFKTRATYAILLSLRNTADEGADIDIGVGTNGGGVAPGRIMALIRPNGPLQSPYCQVTGGIVNDDTWHHFAITRSADGTLELFLDGVSQGTHRTAVSGGPIVTNLRAIGSERYWVQISPAAPSPRNYFVGQVDDFRVYNRALTKAEVQLLQN